MNKLHVSIILFGFLALVSCKEKKDDVDEQPNIILIYTDDHGYADLSCQGILKDVKTPHIDRLAKGGARFTAGYATAPQCVPSRAGILTGRYQQRFGVDENTDGPLPLGQNTIADRLKSVGYTTGMVGKWHLEPLRNQQNWLNKHTNHLIYKGQNVIIPENLLAPYLPHNRGFDEVFEGNVSHYRSTHDLEGNPLPAIRTFQTNYLDRIDVQTNAARQFIKRNNKKPFFLYLAYYAPHVPLAVNQKYLKRFPQKMPKRRRHALALISAVDDGVGQIMEDLKTYNADENTIIFFISDNGAPLGLNKADVAINDHKGAWDGSINDPFLGEKGMLTEGGIRVPYLVYWKNKVLPNQVIDEPVITLDATYTAAKIAGCDLTELEGIDLIPHISKTKKEWKDRLLFWRWRNQEASRNNRWKFLKTSDANDYSFDLKDAHELVDIKKERPDIKAFFTKHLNIWTSELKKPRMPQNKPLPKEEKRWYDHYLKNVVEKQPLKN